MVNTLNSDFQFWRTQYFQAIMNNSSELPECADVDVSNKTAMLAALVFKNPVVMASVAEKICLRRLLKLRRTCKTWYLAMNAEYGQAQGPVQLAHEYNYEKFRQINLTSSLRHSKFSLSKVQLNAVHVRRLFSDCGAFITTLHLTCDETAPNAADFRTIVFELTPSLRKLKLTGMANRSYLWDRDRLLPEELGNGCLTLPGLKSLTLNVLRLPKLDAASAFIADLINAAVNLEHLKSTGPELNMAILQTLRGKKNLHKLKKLNMLNCQFDEVNMLLELSSRTANRLRIEKFHICHDSRDTLREHDIFPMWIHFLELQSQSLRSLTISVFTMEGFPAFRIPSIPSLKALAVDGGRGTVRFGDQLPFLQVVKYSEFTLLPDFENTEAHESVRELAISGDPNSRPDMAAFGNWFPNVRKLTILLSRFDLTELWSTWPNLEVLAIFIYHNDLDAEGNLRATRAVEEFLTGIPQESHVELLRKMRDGEALPDLDRIKTSPGLAHLKELRELTLSTCANFDGVPITDISGYYGLLVPGSKLCTVGIQGTNGRNPFSPKCHKAIQHALGPLGSIDCGIDELVGQAPFKI